jgi:hypothetical protein
MQKLLKLLWLLFRIGAALMAMALVFPLIIAAKECRYFGAGPAGYPAQSSVVRPVAVAAAIDAQARYARLEDQTYLTLPEWYIVYSAEEYGAFIAQRQPSRFPYFDAIVQYWDTYYRICVVTRDRYPLNGSYHVMLGVIGSSFTAEYIVKGLYENSIGMIAELFSNGENTEEEKLAVSVAMDFGRFIHTIPWYDYPYTAKLESLWTRIPVFGPNPVRKIERRIALTLEYGVKAAYGAVIRLVSKAAYGEAETEVLAWVVGANDDLLQDEPKLRLVTRVDATNAIVALPHYEQFTQTVPKLTMRGLRFKEIGAADDILLTVIAPVEWRYNLREGKQLFTMDILTMRDRRRIVVSVPVTELHSVLAQLDKEGFALEHLYDY